MAGRGPAPKDDRRRRNKPEPADVLPAAFDGTAPPLPPSYRGSTAKGGVRQVKYLAATKEWYADWATAPMAARFAKTDWNRLRLVIAPLFDQYQRQPDRGLAAELRLQEERLGATVMDRQRLQQSLPPVQPGAAGAAAAAAAGVPRASSAARRARLSVVGE